MTQSNGLEYAEIAQKAWPIILANAAVPLLGLVDTAVIGHFGSASDLAGLAIASLLFSFLYWGFGFLRMGTTALVAQYTGAGKLLALQWIVVQALSLACAIGVCLILFQWLILHLGLLLLAPPDSVIAAVSEYFHQRIIAAPATLATYVVLGIFIGRGDSHIVLLLQLVLNISNACLDVLFAGYMNMGIKGIALGTCIAEYATLLLALTLLLRQYHWPAFFQQFTVSRLLSDYRQVLLLNSNIFIRTLFLLLGFAFFTHISASFGETTLAANHILLQFIAFSAFFLDGFAHVLEAYAGKAIGEKSSIQLRIALYKTSVLAAITAVLLAVLCLILGASLVRGLTDIAPVVAVATEYLPFVAIYIALAVGAFQLDGLFIGAGYSSAMRNCSIASTIALFVFWYALFSQYANAGLWWAFILYVLVRALSLAYYVPRLLVMAK